MSMSPHRLGRRVLALALLAALVLIGVGSSPSPVRATAPPTVSIAQYPLTVAVPARPDSCLGREEADRLVAAANTAGLGPLGMGRFRLPPVSLPEVTIPAVNDPSLDPASFAEPE